MAKETTKYLTRDDVIKIVDDKNGELYKVFNKLINDVDGLKSSQKRIERALLGDKEFEDIGLARMVNVAYEHARKVDECDLVGRTENVIKQYDKYTENNYWKILEGMIENYKVLKVLAVLIVGSGLVSTANVITIVLKLFGIGE
jgi:hypothetical protein